MSVLARLIGLVGVSAFFLFAGHASSIARALGDPSASSDTKTPLDTVTIEARRQLQKQVDHFVSSVVIQYLNDSLSRWDEPICPLVAGLDRERAEFILGRISEVARTAGARMASERCKIPNFYVIVTPEPDRLLKKWLARNPTIFDRNNGWGGIRRFLNSSDPIRYWYNKRFLNTDGTTASTDAFTAGLEGLSLGEPVPVSKSVIGSRLSYSAVQGLSSVIVVVDSSRMVDLNIGQLADYVAMVGLAEVRVDANTGTAPTILRLFDNTDNPPQGLSEWDRSLLSSLYSTRQGSVMQVGAIKTTMLKQLESH
jgi:hypothetical protein